MALASQELATVHDSIPALIQASPTPKFSPLKSKNFRKIFAFCAIPDGDRYLGEGQYILPPGIRVNMHAASTHSADFDIQTYVDQMALLLDLKIPPEIRPSVVENFKQIVAIAQPVLDFELPDDLEPAITFKP